MAGEPDPIEVQELEFDEQNIDHLAQHEGVTPEDVFAVLAHAPRFFRNLPDRSGTHVMIGPDSRMQFFYIVLAPTSIEGRWRPVTAWRLGRRGLRLYDRGVE